MKNYNDYIYNITDYSIYYKNIYIIFLTFLTLTDALANILFFLLILTANDQQYNLIIIDLTINNHLNIL